jgi:hypothetical protein
MVTLEITILNNKKKEIEKKWGIIFQKACIAFDLTSTLKKCWCKIHQSRGKAVKYV